MKNTFLLSVFFLSTTLVHAKSNQLDEIAQMVKKNVVLQQRLKNCPADSKVISMDKALSLYNGQQSLCTLDHKRCYTQCLNNNAGACFFLALDLQKINKGQEAEALFQKGCEAGLAIACTNRASGIQFYANQAHQKITQKQYKCISTTFKNTCQAQDPWGCTMFGKKLYEGQGVEKNISRALNVLNLSCKYDVSSEACRQATMFKNMILQTNK